MEQPYNEPHSGFWGRGTITAGIVVLIILLLLGWVLWGRGNGTNASPPRPSTSATQGSSTKGNGSGGTGGTTSCNLPAGDQTVPEATPQGINWQLYQTVAVPSSTADGPTVIDGDVARCYAHNPVGALLAISQLSTRYLLAPDWRAVVSQQVVPNAGRSVYETERAQVSNSGANAGGTFNQLAGFKYVTYSPAVATIEMVSRSSTGAMQVVANTVEWLDGDWKLELQPDGGVGPNALPVSSLVGFSIWSGV
jgi:hypothetical protein